MEKISLSPLGQWKLEKADGDPDYDQLQHGQSPFKTPEAAHEAKKEFVSNMNKEKWSAYENRKNIKTGKNELHFLLHRGISTEDPENHPIKPDGKGPNMLDWSDGKTVKTTHNSIHAAFKPEAQSHAEDYSYGGHGHVISFWVPISSIHGHGHSVSRHLEPNKEWPEDTSHTMIAPGQYELHNIDNYNNGKLKNKNMA